MGTKRLVAFDWAIITIVSLVLIVTAAISINSYTESQQPPAKILFSDFKFVTWKVCFYSNLKVLQHDLDRDKKLILKALSECQ